MPQPRLPVWVGSGRGETRLQSGRRCALANRIVYARSPLERASWRSHAPIRCTTDAPLPTSPFAGQLKLRACACAKFCRDARRSSVACGTAAPPLLPPGRAIRRARGVLRPTLGPGVAPPLHPRVVNKAAVRGHAPGEPLHLLGRLVQVAVHRVSLDHRPRRFMGSSYMC